MIILDIDDTLVDHTGAEIEAAVLFGTELSKSIPMYDPDHFTQLWRQTSERHIAEFLRGDVNFQEQRRRRIRDIFNDIDMADDVADNMFAKYLRHYENSWRVFSDVMPFLHKYGKSGIGVISDGSQAQQEAKLQSTGLTPFVRFVVTAEYSGLCKPDSRMFHMACKMASVTPSECIYIGDNMKKDAIGASTAGLRGIWLNRNGDPVPDGIEAIKSLTEYSPNNANAADAKNRAAD